MRPVVLVGGQPVTPEQLTGSAASFPSLVDSAATVTTAKVAETSPPDDTAKSGKRPAGALSVDAKDVVPDKKFTRSSPGKPGSGVLLPQARDSASLMGMTIASYYPDDRSMVDTLTPELRAYGYNGGLGGPYYEYRYKV